MHERGRAREARRRDEGTKGERAGGVCVWGGGGWDSECVFLKPAKLPVSLPSFPLSFVFGILSYGSYLRPSCPRVPPCPPDESP